MYQFRRTIVPITSLSLLVLFSASAAAQWVWTPQTGRFVNLRRMPKESPELQVEHARSLMLQGDYGEAMDETEKFVDFYGDTELADENQFLRGEIKLAQENYVDAAQELQRVVDSYPESDLYDDVITMQYEIGNELYNKGVENLDGGSKWYTFGWSPFKKRPLRKAVEVYRMVKTNEPFTPQAAEAQYKIGESYYVREDYLDAALEYQLLLEQYPDSEWVDNASMGLIKSYEAQSLPPAYDQSTSALAVQAIDDHLVRFPATEQETDLLETRQEMRERIGQQRLLTAEYYLERQQPRSARITLESLVEEYPDTEAATEANEMLSEMPPDDSLLASFLQPN